MSIRPTELIRARVYERDGARCRRCDRSIVNYPSSIHHRKPRGMGGTTDVRSNDLRNLVRLCGTGTTGCHGYLEAHRATAYDTGWLIRSYDDLDTPMLTTDGRLVRLLVGGEWSESITAASSLAARQVAQDALIPEPGDQ